MDSNKGLQEWGIFCCCCSEKCVDHLCKLLGNGISLTLQIIFLGMQFKLAKSLYFRKRLMGLESIFTRFINESLIFKIFFWEAFIIYSVLDNSIQYPSNFFKTWGIKMGGRNKRHSTKRWLVVILWRKNRKECKIKCKCCVTKMMTVKNIFCDSWWFELLSWFSE